MKANEAAKAKRDRYNFIRRVRRSGHFWIQKTWFRWQCSNCEEVVMYPHARKCTGKVKEPQ